MCWKHVPLNRTTLCEQGQKKELQQATVVAEVVEKDELCHEAAEDSRMRT